jgi:hypothetical protein
MPKAPGRSRQRRRLSLSARVSLLILCAAILPLGVVVGFNDYQARNTLIKQGQLSLGTDANAKSALVDVYMRERALDGVALGTLPTSQDLLACKVMPQLSQQVPAALTPYLPLLQVILKCDDPVYNKASSVRALNVGIQRDTNYTIWSLYDAGLNQVLSTSTSLPTLPKEDLPALKQGNPYTSDVHYDPKAGNAYVQIYTPIRLDMQTVAGEVKLAAQSGQLAQAQLTPDQVNQLIGAIQAMPSPLVGYLRATLKLSYIWSIVGSEVGVNGSGSSAFIADENGIRIADANASERLSAVAPLDPTTLQTITAEQRFGTGDPVATANLPVVAAALKPGAAQDTFQSVATPNAKTTFQFVGVHLKNVPWTYFVLAPLPTVTQVADDQVRASLLAAGVVAILAVLLGLLIGTRMATPVQRSVADLQGATDALNTLATKQRNSASEQLWVVDACKTGLESVRYLSDAMHQASQRIVDAANWFGEYWDRLSEEQAQRTVQHLRELAQYVEEAARRQWASSDRLDKAITVTTQVSDQLANGATAAADSAEQLEEVVHQLQRVVGGRANNGHTRGPDEVGDEEQDERSMPGASGRQDDFGGRLAMPAPAGQRQLAGPTLQPAQGGRQPLMPGGWQSGPSGGNGPTFGQQRGQAFGPGPQSGPSQGEQQYGQGIGAGYGEQQYGQGAGAGYGQQQYGGDGGQGAPAGWPAGAGNGRGVRVWEDQ